MNIRMMALFLVPGWVWLLGGAVLLCGAPLGLVLIAVSGVGGSTAAVFACQCEAAVGLEPGTTTARAADPCADGGAGKPVATPTANPFADLVIEPDDKRASDRDRACVHAMREAPFQLAPLGATVRGVGVECARRLALAYGGQATQTAGSPDRWDTAAEWNRTVLYRAARATGADCAATVEVPVGSGSCTGTGAAASDTAGAAPLLPKTVAEQSLCGQRVDPRAVSPGDLVFWRYRDNAATRAGIAVGAGMLVGVDAITGVLTEQRIPDGEPIVVKRIPLRGSA